MAVKVIGALDESNSAACPDDTADEVQVSEVFAVTNTVIVDAINLSP